MHGVFVGMTTAFLNGGGGDASLARCRVMVFEKPEAIDKTG